MPGREIVGMSIDELLALPASFSIDVAGRAWGMGRTKARRIYRDDPSSLPFRVQPLGRELRVTKTELFRSLGLSLDGTPTEPPAALSA
jgi:hypothetical protein